MTDSQFKIEKLAELIEKFAGKVVLDSKVTRLTAPGENFGSIVLRVDTTLSDTNGNQETLYAIAKCLPEDEYFRKLFNVEVTVKAEMAFYTDVIPQMQQFQREQGVEDVIDCFPKFYGGRINLDAEGDVVDDHAVLILENLKVRGFRNIDRTVGFSLEEAKMILKDLAAFHAVPLALKLKKPQLFEEKIRKYCGQSDEQPVPENSTLLMQILGGYDECGSYLTKLEELMNYFIANPAGGSSPPVSEMFGTLIHVDMWVNNTMQRFEDGRIAENKFVDFQNYMYESPVRDLIFFLWSSCRYIVLHWHLDDLVRHYYRHFVKNLEMLDVDTAPYTFQRFTEEMRTYAKEEMMHSLFFTTYVVFGQKTDDGMLNFDLTKDQVPDEVRKRIVLMVKHYGKLGWF